MKKMVFVSSLLIALIGIAGAQTSSSKPSATSVPMEIISGTAVSTQLQGSLNADHAKVGDEVILITVKTVKQNGQVIVEKGSKFIGHVMQVKKSSSDSAGSIISVSVDTLLQNGVSVPISAIITSITKYPAAKLRDSDSIDNSATTASPSPSTPTAPVAQSIPGLRISRSANAFASSSSTLSISSGNLELENGTVIDLELRESTEVIINN